MVDAASAKSAAMSASADEFSVADSGQIPNANQWVGCTIGLISGPEFDGEREIRLEAVVNGVAYAECYVGHSSKVQRAHGSAILSADADGFADQLIEGLRADFPEHTIRPHIASQPAEVEPIPRGSGAYGVCVSDEDQASMWAQSLDFVRMAVARRSMIESNQSRLLEAIASESDLNIDIARASIVNGKAEYRDFIKRMIEEVDGLRTFAQAELAAVESVTDPEKV